MSSRPPRPTPERDDRRRAPETPVDLERLAERILESDLIDLELRLKLKNA